MKMMMRILTRKNKKDKAQGRAIYMLLLITLLFLALLFVIAIGVKEHSDVWIRTHLLLECIIILLAAITFILFYIAWHLGIR